MNANAQEGSAAGRPEDIPQYVVGMDAHSRKLAISVWDWADPWNQRQVLEVKNFEIAALEATYRGRVPADSVTVIEASTNSAILKDRLEAIGYRAVVVRSDVIANKERRRRVCDIQDARNLARAYMKKEVGAFVWTPSPEFGEMREIFFAHRDTVKDMTRLSNRIWAICSRHGYDLPKRSSDAKAETIRAMVARLGVDGFTRNWLEHCVAEYERLRARRDELEAMMAEKVVGNAAMLRLMQLHGVGFRTSFLTVAVTEDPHRFPSASKFSAYAGGAPVLDTSGEDEERARARGGTGKPMDGTGRTDLKHLYAEAGQTVLSSCADSRLGKWGWRKVMEGKHRNKVVCAIGRKLQTYAWHIMCGHPAPDRMGEAFFKRKMFSFYSEVGAKRMRELGHGSRTEFAEAMAAKVFGHLPPASPDSGENAA